MAVPRIESRRGLFSRMQYFNQPAENLGDASVADLQDPRDVAGPRARVGQLDDLLPGGVG
jgi:hypothetical protein